MKNPFRKKEMVAIAMAISFMAIGPLLFRTDFFLAYWTTFWAFTSLFFIIRCLIEDPAEDGSVDRYVQVRDTYIVVLLFALFSICELGIWFSGQWFMLILVPTCIILMFYSLIKVVWAIFPDDPVPRKQEGTTPQNAKSSEAKRAEDELTARTYLNQIQGGMPPMT